PPRSSTRAGGSLSRRRASRRRRARPPHNGRRRPRPTAREADGRDSRRERLEREHHVVGPPGVGKSHLAAALGVKAVKNGFSVAHFLLDDLMHILRADAAIPPARLRARRYFNAALVIIDEVGFRPLDRAEANLFFRLVSARYERGAIVLTSNKHVRDWPEIF